MDIFFKSIIVVTVVLLSNILIVLISKFYISRCVYSVLKLLKGFAMPAFIAWKLIVINAITKAIIPARAKTGQEISTRYAKPASH